MAGLSDPYTILRVGPQTFTSQHIDNTNSPKWEEMYEVRKRGRVLWCRWYRRWNTLSFPFYFVLYLRDWTLRVLGMSIFIHGNMRPQPASIQVPVSLHVLVCVSGTSGHCPWSAWSRVGGGGLWQRPRPGWFPGQVHMNSSCLLCAYVESHIVAFHLSPFMASWTKYATFYLNIQSHS